VINELLIGNDIEESGRGPISRYCPGICLEELKIHEIPQPECPVSGPRF
jgi:hypothetical protein